MSVFQLILMGVVFVNFFSSCDIGRKELTETYGLLSNVHFIKALSIKDGNSFIYTYIVYPNSYYSRLETKNLLLNVETITNPVHINDLFSNCEVDILSVISRGYIIKKNQRDYQIVMVLDSDEKVLYCIFKRIPDEIL